MSSNNTTCINCAVDYEFELMNGVFIVIYSLLTIFILAGNILTIVAIVKTDVLRTVSNTYVALLAFADCIAGLSLPLQMVFEFPEGRRMLDTNKALCLWRNVTFLTSANLSICSLLVIAFDRAVYIGRPFLYNRIATYTNTVWVMSLLIFIALLLGSMSLYVNNWQSGVECRSVYILTREYRLYGQIIPICLCFILTGACYGYIFHLARKQQASIQCYQQTTSPNDIKIIKVLFLVYGIFLICWLPAVIFTILSLIFTLPTIYLDIAMPLAVLNSGMNFLIYAMKNKDYRSAFKKIVCYSFNEGVRTRVWPLDVHY